MSSFNLQHKPLVPQRSPSKLTTNRLSWYDVPEVVKQQLMLVSAHWGDRRDDPQIRLYINAYAASGLILARLGETELARQIAVQVSEIEIRNEFGGNVVRDILDHPDDEEEDDEENVQENSQENETANSGDRNRAGES